MSRRIAILVLAHKAAPLRGLLRCLDDRFNVFVHMDAKTDIKGTDLHLPDHVRLIDQRVPVFWGGWSMIQATLALIDCARATSAFQRYVLVSGDALPALSQDRVEAALLDHNREFIDLEMVPDAPSLAGTSEAASIARFGNIQPWRRYNPVFWDHRLLNPFQREAAAAYYGITQDRVDWLRGDVARLVTDILAERQSTCPFQTFWFGSQWWALTGETVAALRHELERADVRRWFGAIQVPDEHVFHTAVANNRHWLAGRAVVGSPMWTDHSRRSHGRDSLDAIDFRTAAARGAQVLFARKFDPDDTPDIAAAIDAGRYERDVLGQGD